MKIILLYHTQDFQNTPENEINPKMIMNALNTLGYNTYVDFYKISFSLNQLDSILDH